MPKKTGLGKGLDALFTANPFEEEVQYQKEVLDAALTRAPYKVTVYIQKLASLIHGFYTECRLLDRNNLELTSSRLALCKASMIVLKNALGLIGVSAPEKM